MRFLYSGPRATLPFTSKADRGWQIMRRHFFIQLIKETPVRARHQIVVLPHFRLFLGPRFFYHWQAGPGDRLEN